MVLPITRGPRAQGTVQKGDDMTMLFTTVQKIFDRSDLYGADGPYVEAAWKLRAEVLEAISAYSLDESDLQRLYTETVAALGSDPLLREPEPSKGEST